MNIATEIQTQKNIIAEAMKMKRALKVQRKALSAEIKGWDESAEKASVLVELLEKGYVDGYQQTIKGSGKGEQ